MSNVTIFFGNQTVVLQFEGFKDEVNVDELTSIDYSNLYGEIVTVSALLNKIGLLRAEAESAVSLKQLECDVYSADLGKRYRREANVNGGKFTIPDGEHLVSIKLTEDSINQAIILDPIYQAKKNSLIESKKNFGFIDSLYWAIQSKDKKLSLITRPVTPEEFVNEIIEGEINGMFIKKLKDNWTQNS